MYIIECIRRVVFDIPFVTISTCGKTSTPLIPWTHETRVRVYRLFTISVLKPGLVRPTVQDRELVLWYNG